MFKFVQLWWRSLRLKNQIFLLQGVLITIVFISLIYLCVKIIDQFSIFLQNDFIQKFLFQSIISSFNILVGQTNELGKIGYEQLLSYKGQLENLYYFQIKNNIISTSELDNCLESPQSQQFYSYQFCYGIYGNKSDDSVFQTIKTYISLQNQFTPLNNNEFLLAQYNIYLDGQMFFSQYKGEYLRSIDKDIEEGINIMINLQIPFYVKQIKGQTGNKLHIFQSFPGSNIATGISYFQSQSIYFQTIKQDKFYNQRQVFITLQGEIITDSYDVFPEGGQFYNTSLTGLNISQFEKILQVSDKSSSPINECWQQLQDKILCLVDNNDQHQLIFPFMITSQGLPYIIMVIVDANSMSEIQQQFQQQLDFFFQQQIQLICALFVVGLIICFWLQLFLIVRLNKPLLQLQNIVKYQMNMNQYQIQRIIRLKQVQSQIKKLSDSFFDVINMKQKIRYSCPQSINNQKLMFPCCIIQNRYDMIQLYVIKSRFKLLYDKEQKF